MPTDLERLVVRPAEPSDAAAVAELFTRARAAAVPQMPPSVHTAEEDRAWIADQIGGEREAWVAEDDGEPVGLLLLDDDWLHSLYVRPDRTGEGIGSLLLEVAMGLRPAGLRLWVFESNTGARRLYERHGFEVVERTDGSGNEERSPDLRMVWPGQVAQLRARIDEIDDRLAELLNERAALTARIQGTKAVSGRLGRDLEREAEIVARMAPRAPNLGAGAVGRIMHTVISESLDAAGESHA